MNKKIIYWVKKYYKQFSVFELSVTKQKEILLSMGEPENDIQRSFFQFKCQQHLNSKLKSLSLNLIAFFIVPLVLFYFFIKGFFCKKNQNSKENVYLDQGIHDIMPDYLIKTKDDIINANYNISKVLNYNDLFFLLRLYFSYAFYSFFVLKSTYKIALYRAIINQYKPKNIIVASEYSFTSSLLTNYCERHSICHINLMHGEKLFYIRDSFFRFHICYVWEEHYKELFISLRAYPTQFEIIYPSFFKFDNLINTGKFLFTYYLGNEDEQKMIKIEEFLSLKVVNKNNIAIRPHPRYSDIELVKKIFSGYTIENPLITSIRDSFSNTKSLISLYSTILYQGRINNKEYFIDNISDSIKYEQLKELNYFLISQPHKKLSNISCYEK